MSRNYRGRKNKFHQTNIATAIMPIADYIEMCERRKNYPGRISNGVMTVCIDGKWVSQQEFDELVPPVIVMDFMADTTNCDGTKLWMIK